MLSRICRNTDIISRILSIHELLQLTVGDGQERTGVQERTPTAAWADWDVMDNNSSMTTAEGGRYNVGIPVLCFQV